MKKVLALVVLAGSVTLFSCNNSGSATEGKKEDSTAKTTTPVVTPVDTTHKMDAAKPAAGDTTHKMDATKPADNKMDATKPADAKKDAKPADAKKK